MYPQQEYNTHTVRIKCAAAGCEEVDLCPSCFCKGKEAGKHKRWHPYKVVEQHSYPIFTESWGADEELLLIEGLTLYGLGNWQDAAEHVGTRSREECEDHYLEVWVGREREQPVAERDDVRFDIDAETFQSRKKRRIEEMRTKAIELPNPQNSKPLVSAPTNHEIGGFMPGRLDFEHEVHDEAENAVKDMEFGLVFRFGGDEQPAEGDGEGEVPSSIPTREDVGVGDAQAAAASGGSSRTNAVASGSGTTAMDVDDDEDEDTIQLQAAASSGVSQRGLGSATAGKSSGAAKKSSASSTKQPPSAIPPHLRTDPSLASPTPEPDDLDDSPSGSLFGATPPPPPPSQGTKTASSSSASIIDASLPLPFSTDDPLPFSDSAASSLPFAADAPLPFASEAPPPPPPPPPPPAPIPVNTDSPDYPEDEDDLELKLAVLEIYNDKLDRRKEAKNLLFQRGLMEHKKIVAADRKKPQKERDLIQKYKVFAKLQTAEDHEVFTEGLLYEQALRARIIQLQTYRSKGITSVADAERYEAQVEYRTTGVVDPKGRTPHGNRFSLGPADQPLSRNSREGSAGRSAYVASVGGRKPPAPLNLATAASLHLLSPAEQELCSTLRILPKPYLMIKETLIREYARRGGNLRRREARSLVKIDVNKTARIWDLMEEMGVFRTALDPGKESSVEQQMEEGRAAMEEIVGDGVEEQTGLRPVVEEGAVELVGGEGETPAPPSAAEEVIPGEEGGMDGVVELTPPPPALEPGKEVVEVGGDEEVAPPFLV